ncbi:hypothetical protein ACFE33_08930 [Falsihalocynthiibacter sp. SS001]|uniref:hypothetical protein n=1 Tax=Falsihalocynthiibacter sp. SS001 TaxID=3349698 RepID=UPI0036D3141D
MRIALRILFWALVIGYVAALILLAIGMFGLLGQEKDPLSAVFLIPLGLPWNMFMEGAPDSVLIGVGLFSPLINIAIIGWLARRLDK